MHFSILTVAVVFLAGCAGDAPQLVPVRLDGQSIGGSPAMVQTYRTDRAICVGEAQKAKLSGSTFYGGSLSGAIVAGMESEDAARDVLEGCMAQRGYTYIDERQANAAAAEFRSNAQSPAGTGPGLTTGSVGSERRQ